jgi:hypothetical protein
MVKKDMDRRNFLGASMLGAAALAVPGSLMADRRRLVRAGGSLDTGLGSEAITGCDNSAFLDELAHAFAAKVYKQDGFKWGWKLLVQDICPDRYWLTLENEYAGPAECPPEGDPTRLLTTVLDVRKDCNLPTQLDELVWTRVENRTAHVHKPTDVDYMRLFPVSNPDAYINNIAPPLDGLFQEEPAAKRNFRYASDAGVNINKIGPVWSHALHQRFFHAALRFKSDPWAVMTLGGTGPCEYKGTVYRFQGEHDLKKVLTAKIDLAHEDAAAMMTRIDAESQVNTNFHELSEIYMWLPVFGSGGKIIGEDNKYKVDTAFNTQSQVYLPEVYNAFFNPDMSVKVNYWNPGEPIVQEWK